MDKKLAEILVCPLCNGKLSYLKQDKLLLCQFDRVTFGFDEDIPVLLPESGTSVTAEKLESLKAQL